MNMEKYCLYCCREIIPGEPCPFCGGKDVRKHPMYLPPGTVLENKYLIGRTLGHGGFGITYIGVDLNLNMRVAIKEHLPRDLAARNTDALTVVPFVGNSERDFYYGLEKFTEEGRALANFSDHPNIVSVHNFFSANGTAYLVMSYLEGRSLKELMDLRRGKVLEQEVVQISMMVLNGLKSVHSKGILHRDIKPDNIFITNDGNAILIDFGSARSSIGRNSGDISKIVSEGYSPFEQYTLSAKEGPFTDLYSVGATMYHALSGEAPFTATERAERDDLVPLRNIRGLGVSVQTSDVVQMSMSLSPVNRFQNAGAMIASLSSMPHMSPDANSDQKPSKPIEVDERTRRAFPFGKSLPKTAPPKDAFYQEGAEIESYSPKPPSQVIERRNYNPVSGPTTHVGQSSYYRQPAPQAYPPHQMDYQTGYPRQQFSAEKFWFTYWRGVIYLPLYVLIVVVAAIVSGALEFADEYGFALGFSLAAFASIILRLIHKDKKWWQWGIVTTVLIVMLFIIAAQMADAWDIFKNHYGSEYQVHSFAKLWLPIYCILLNAVLLTGLIIAHKRDIGYPIFLVLIGSLGYLFSEYENQEVYFIVFSIAFPLIVACVWFLIEAILNNKNKEKGTGIR